MTVPLKMPRKLRLQFKWAIRAAVLLLLCVMVSGCLYPKSERKENQIAAKEYMLVVQNAIDQFHELTGVLPIKNSEMDTPIYEKYVIDFHKLKQRGLISLIPTNAFENGGTNYYVLVDVETKPTVKLMSLLTFQSLADLQKKVDLYKAGHDGKLPIGEKIAEGFHRIDFASLGMKSLQIQSVYTGQYLGVFLNDKGKALVDYAPDIMQLLSKKGLEKVDPKVDLRTYLVSEYAYVPVGSTPYYWNNNEPMPANP